MIRPQPPQTRLFGPIALLVLAALLLGGCGVTTKVVEYWEGQDSSLRKRVSVAPFSASQEALKPQAQAMQKIIAKGLEQQGGLVLIDFASLDQEMEKLPQKSGSAEDLAYEAGRRLGLNTVLAGNLTDLAVVRQMKGIYGFRDNAPFLALEGEFRLLDMTTSTILAQTSFRQQTVISDVEAEAITMNNAAPDAKIVAKLVAEMTKEAQAWIQAKINAQPWGGTVLEVQGDKVLITVGRDTGLPTGTNLVVYALGERIKCGTGQEICLTGPAVAKVRLLELGARTAWAEVVQRISPPAPDKKAPAPPAPPILPGQVVRTR